MGKLKDKHDHALTQWLKVIIFAILMLAPFFSVLTRCLYVSCNKNAKESYYGETINQETQVSGFVNDIDTYQYFNLSNVTITGATNFYVSDFRSFGTMAYSQDTTDNVKELLLYEYNSNPYVKLTYNNDLTQFIILSASNKETTFSFYLRQPVPSNPYNNSFYHIEYNNYSYLDNVFEYSITKLSQEQHFNWTKNTALYNSINAMTQGLGFEQENNTMALLLTYWMFLIIVYVIIDIVLSLFTKLTHTISGNA